MTAQPLQDLMQTLERSLTQFGDNLITLSKASPVLLLFLRHAACPFCREAVDDIARARRAIEGTGTRIVLIHMRDSKEFHKLLGKHELLGVDRICDQEKKLYKALGLKRATLWQLFGPKSSWRVFREGVLWRHGFGRISADSFQMPGLFLLKNAAIVRRFRHRTVADRPDYLGLCAETA